MSQNTIKVSGRVLDRAKLRGIAGLRVEAQNGNAKEKSLTNQQGVFTITFDQARHPDLFNVTSPEIIFTFNVFAGETLIKSTQEAVPREAKDGKFELDIVLGAPDSNGSLIVKGIIRTADGEPLASAIARAFDRDLRREETLGESITDQTGRYEIHYSSTQFRRGEKASADLVVKAFAADGSPLAASPVLFNAPPSAEINLTIPEAALPIASEFDKTSQAIAPLLDKLSIVELEENQQFQDISFLSGETSIASERIARLALAHRLAAASRIKPPFWYALLATPFYQTTDSQTLDERSQVILNALPSLDTEAIDKALANAFDQNLIPSSLKQKVAAWTEAFLTFVAKRAVSGDGASALKGVLEDAGIESAAKQEEFARLLQQHHGLTPDLLDALKKDQSFKDAEIADIETTFNIAELAQGNLSVARVLKKTRGIRQPDKVRLIAKISEEDWIKLVRDNLASGELELPVDLTPSDLPTDVELRPAEVYGKMLAKRFREAFPTAAFLGGLERSMRNGGPKGLKQPERLSKFLEENQDFELLTTPVDEFLESKLDPKQRATAKDEDFHLELKAVQRTFKLEPNFEATNTLLADDLHSAQKIYRMGEAEFVSTYGNRPGFTAETARLAWDRAADTYAAVLTIVGDLKALEADGLPAVLGNGNKLISTFPNWDNLFKTGDICECEQCRSVFSPAAYFADLLMFLKARKAKNQTSSVKDILFSRRPDLGGLELSCENANTPLPYIDIVNEVLEDVIAMGANDLPLPALTSIADGSAATKAAVAQALAQHGVSLGTDFTLSQVGSSDRWVAHGDVVTYLLKKKGPPSYFAEVLRNTKASATELRANPQYVNPKAYDKLKEATYPFALPFDLFNEEVRAAFQKVRIKRWELMETLRGGLAQANAPNNASEGEVAAEYFGISVDRGAAIDEKRIILNQNANDQYQFWGEPDNPAMIANMSEVDVFLRKAGLEYNQLLALLDLKFIKAQSDIGIHHLDSSCDTAQKRIEPLDADILDRMHRFLRLFRKLKDRNLKMWELDLLIRQTNIGNGSLDEPFLINLMHFFRVKSLLGSKVSVEQACSLFGNLNFETHFTRLHEKREDALYQNLFLNKRLIHPLDPAFKIVEIAPGQFDVAPGGNLNDHLPVIQAALGMREPDLMILKGLLISVDLNLDSLSFLYRHALLAKTLRFKAQEWATVLKLAGQSTAAFADPQSAWEFLEEISWLKNSSFTPDELNWLLSADRSAKSAVKENDSAKFLFGLRKALQAIRNQYDASQYDFLQAVPPSDEERLAALLTTLLQKLNRDDASVKFFIEAVRGDVSAEITVSGLPAGFTFKLSNIPISYDEPTQTLRFTGVMTAAQLTILTTHPSLAAAANNPSYVTAIGSLFDTLQQKHFDHLDQVRLGVKFFEPIFTAPLDVLPQATDFKAQLPAELALKISYDAERRKLRFTGIMSAEEQTTLEGLSPDQTYRDAVASLAVQPQDIAAPDERIWLLADADLNHYAADSDSAAKRMAIAITKALAYLSKTEAENAVVQQSSGKLGLTAAITRVLATNFVITATAPDNILQFFTGNFSTSSEAIDRATFPNAFEAWEWLSRVAAILKKWKIHLEEFGILREIGADAQLLDFLSLPVNVSGSIASLDNFLRTARLLKLRDTLPETEITLLEVLKKLRGPNYDEDDFAADVQGLNEDWNTSDAKKIAEGSLDLAYPNDYLLAENWERLRTLFGFFEKLNAGMDVAKIFANPTVGKTESDALKQLLRSKFGAESWLTISTEIQDVLRERKREGLVAWLLHHFQPSAPPSGKWEDSDDVYANYLMDVEMSACQLTSRLVEASGSVQRLVQRCLIGLEPEVVVKAGGDDGDSAWRWWDWMKKYRVWEANRKVYLYAENWIEPELRGDKSEFFIDLENELRQNEINQQTVEAAFLNYLQKLDEVAQLEIAGFYQEDDGDRTILHVFGHTRGGEPHIYYYRRFDYMGWTAWEKVDLDIAGDYLIPAVISNQLFLFWPIFTEVSDERANSKVAIPTAGAEDEPLPETSKRLQMKMAMSRYRQRKWSPKKISKDAYESLFPYTGEIIKSRYRFWAIDRSAIDGRFIIRFDGHSEPKFPLHRQDYYRAEMSGCFELGGCDGGLELCTLLDQFKHLLIPDRTELFISLHKWIERQSRPVNEFSLINNSLISMNNQTMHRADVGDPMAITPILIQTPNLFKVSPPWHLSPMDKVWLDASDTKSGGNRPASPSSFDAGGIKLVGAWLPFFYADRKRTFLALPSLRREGIRQYYPDIKNSFREMQDIFEASVQVTLDNLQISALSEAQRAQWETIFKTQFPDAEEQPPYTDAQFLALMKRYLMKRFNMELGNQSLRLFQSRQFHFKNFYHPFACDFAKLAGNPLKGIQAMMSRETQLKNSGFSFKNVYQPTLWVVDTPGEDYYPVEDVDFTSDGAYSPYNWELFFHAPLLIANSLSKNQRFEEAMEWYHFIFNPIGVESETPGGSAISKYWNLKPFYQTTDTDYIQQRIDNILRLLANDTTVPGFSAELKQELEAQVRDWRYHPFEPHRLARYRNVIYQKATVMKYLDNLIAWGDFLFRQDSMESINEATQLYMLAAATLGPRPKMIPPQAKSPVESFKELEDKLDSFSNALVQVENFVPVMPGFALTNKNAPPLPMLYFCIPRNEKMLGYWDTVADRLYKIRHCMNIEGVVRQLALFEPTIDPGQLVKAVAGGADIGSALSDLNAPLPLYRFNMVLQKANEVCNDVKALGGALLSALEKKDAEALSLLRQGQESKLLEAIKDVREKQIEEAKENLEGLKKSKILIETRRDYYRDIIKILPGEQLSLDKQKTAFDHQKRAQQINIAASILGYLPSLTIGASGFGGSPLATAQWGVGNIISALQAAAGSQTQLSNAASFEAGRASTLAGYDRRADDWSLQQRLADKELAQMEKQIAAAELRIAIAEKELANQVLQIENSKATDAFMRSKFTNEELYLWLAGEISGVYFQSYKLAYDLAKQAERAFRFELGLQDSNYINFGYWDSLKKGLQAGERLQYDLRRLESDYYAQNSREYELTKHISLALLDPLALIQLRETGRCFFDVPEEIFDLDFPGHYFRRIKSVSLSLPCVVGPYTTICCTLRLLNNSIRRNTAGEDYGRNTDEQGLPTDDDRFIENNIPVKAMAASSAQNDSGVFELNFRDERYLPFEGAGVISRWSLELFNDPPSNNPDQNNPDFGQPLRQFDYKSISDAVLHVKYTSQEDAGQFKNSVVGHLRDYFYQDGTTPSLRLFNLRQEFPAQWHRLLNENIFELEMSSALFPFRDGGKILIVHTIWLLARCENSDAYNVTIINPLLDPVLQEMDLLTSSKYGGLHVANKDVSEAEIQIGPTGSPWKFKVMPPIGVSLQDDSVKLEDILLVLEYEWQKP